MKKYTKTELKLELKYSLLALLGAVPGVAGILPAERIANLIGEALPPGILQLLLFIGYCLLVMAVTFCCEFFVYLRYMQAKGRLESLNHRGASLEDPIAQRLQPRRHRPRR
ncbi:MAG: hypothetical protein LBB75_06885 [Oscillospiraceae bacterium]|jgi:hypothetical protein|nr:hypothetical protein [Oscillospiraceae bacterium]